MSYGVRGHRVGRDLSSSTDSTHLLLAALRDTVAATAHLVVSRLLRDLLLVLILSAW